MSLTDLLISSAFIVICCTLAQVARKALDRFTSIHGLVKELILEAIAAAELCSTCFELIIGKVVERIVERWMWFMICFLVADNFGIATYAIVLFLLTIWWSQVWGDSTACPYTHMEDMVEGKTTPRDVALKTWAQLMGGCCVWRFVQFFWWLELAQTHKGKAFEDCSADLQVNCTFLLHSVNFMFQHRAGFPSGWCGDWRHCHTSLSLGLENTERKESQVHDDPRQFHRNLTCRCR